MTNTLLLVSLIEPLKNYVGEIILLHYVVPAHLIGGLLIIIGLLTRWAVAAQIPVLISALFVNVVLNMSILNLITVLITLFISVFFLFFIPLCYSYYFCFPMQGPKQFPL